MRVVRGRVEGYGGGSGGGVRVHGEEKLGKRCVRDIAAGCMRANNMS